MRKKNDDRPVDIQKIGVNYIIVSCILLVIFCMVVMFNLYSNSSYQAYGYASESRIEKTSSTKIANATTVGWLMVQGTNIDYPVIKETEEAYLTGEDYLWQPNNYVEKQNREVIYGHNILNVSSNPLITDPTHSRFEQLMSFVDYDFAKDNLYVQYTKDGKDVLYKIYAVSFDYRENENGDSYEDKNELTTYINNVRKLSIYDYDVDVNSSDDLISLITCTRYFGLYGKTQFRVDARRVRESEKNVKYSVETNQNYDIIK